MTRVNCIPPKYLLDEWVCAGCREGLRPLNKTKQGKYVSDSQLNHYSLGKGHELWLKDHLIFTVRQWWKCKEEWMRRGYKGCDWHPTLLDGDIPEKQLKDYVPTKADYRHNLARLCDRFRKRNKPYHFKGTPVNTYREFKHYIKWVKEELKL